MPELRFPNQTTGISDRLAAFDEGEAPPEPVRSVAFDPSTEWTTIEVEVGDTAAELIVLLRAVSTRWIRSTAGDLVSALLEQDPQTFERVIPQISRALALLPAVVEPDMPAPAVRVTEDSGVELTWTRQGHRIELRFEHEKKVVAYVVQPGVPAVLRPVETDVDVANLRGLLDVFRPKRASAFMKDLADPSKGEQLVSQETAQRGQALLNYICATLPRLFTPVVGPGPDGVLGMTWETEHHHLNLELFPDGHLEVFHEDLRTHDLWGDDSRRDLSPEFIARLRQAIS